MREFREGEIQWKKPCNAFIEGVHLSLFPELGNKVRRAFIEGVHLESVHLERVDCIYLFTV